MILTNFVSIFLKFLTISYGFWHFSWNFLRIFKIFDNFLRNISEILDFFLHFLAIFNNFDEIREFFFKNLNFSNNSYKIFDIFGDFLQFWRIFWNICKIFEIFNYSDHFLKTIFMKFVIISIKYLTYLTIIYSFWQFLRFLIEFLQQICKTLTKIEILINFEHFQQFLKSLCQFQRYFRAILMKFLRIFNQKNAKWDPKAKKSKIYPKFA